MSVHESFKNHCEHYKDARVNAQGKKKVAIVGGGPSGLVSLRRVLDSFSLIGTLIEQKDDVGGIWYYKDEKKFPASSQNSTDSLDDLDNPENTTAMYDNLSCNLPYVLLELRDFKHERFAYTFATQQQVHHYLREYATHFNLWPHIRLNTSVVDVRPEFETLREGTSGKWIIETHNLQTNTFSSEIYDAVMICTGKHAYPYQRPIPGLKTFKGKVMHAKFFKNADDFIDQSVVLIGLGPSAADLALVLSTTAKKITVCHKFINGKKLGIVPKNVHQMSCVKKVTGDGIVTEENERVSCDCIIFCTGYGIKFPFLNPSCGVTIVEEKYVPHLYNKMIFTKRPTLFFLNLCYQTPEYVCMEIQVCYAVNYLEGYTKLPSFQDMEAAVKAEEEDKIQREHPHSLWLQIGDLSADATWNYFWRIAEEIGIKDQFKDGPLLEQVYRISMQRMFGSLAIYKSDRLRIRTQTMWEYMLAAKPEFPDSKFEIVTIIANPDFTASVERLQLSDG
ncbi:unnamed protein product [Orchesella dallaii]|uniref:Flavin-containing monooxygenase n=1 Tax=Orchesella dallaii TaxID=48710 RepID=A0ABP1QQ85_9HEXA